VNGWRDFDVAGYMANLPGRHAPKKRGKYGAVKTEIDGFTFASKHEAARYVDLKAQQERRLISGLELQPTYPLTVVNPQGVTVRVASYVGDFRYQRDGRTILEDAKGWATETYKLKRKWVEALYGIEVVEV
jgi:hypothetical protein